MDPLRQYVLLALVLLEVAFCAEDAVCRDGRSNCEVMGISGELANVVCGSNTSESSNPRIVEENTSTGTSRMSHLPDRTLQYYISDITSGDTNGTIANNETASDDLENYDVIKEDANNTSIANNESTTEMGATTQKHDKTHGSKMYSSTNDTSKGISNEHWLSISTIQVTSIGNVLLLDLTYFSNARTLSFNNCNTTLFQICGATTVTNLSSTSSKLRDVSFLRHLPGLEHLNLSDNTIKAMPVTELPPSIVSLDLSYNNIVFDTNISLPEKIQILNVSYNNVTTVEGVILKGNVVVLDIRGNRLTKVPNFYMNSLEELYLSNNNIYCLQQWVFATLSSLTILDLKANCLSSLEENVFQGLNRLQWLDMSENNVVSLAPSTFQFLNNLLTLLLSGNTNLGNLQDVEDASLLFGTGQRLQTIEASRTNITRIPSTLTRSVRKLLLAHNAIRSIQCGELDSFPLLQVMDFSYNLIAEIEEDALGRLDCLSDLLLSGNKLTSIPKSLPDQLQVLDLRCNLIKQLNNFDFLGLQKLRVLLLSKNRISIVEDGAFGQLTSLEVLDLSHNPIKSLSRTSFIGPRKLKEIYLISLTDLIPLHEPLSFPAPESAHLEVLNMESSPVLATQLMDDVAALTMFHELFELNLNHCRLSTLRSDLPKYLPRLHKLEITGNVLNCTNIIWLVKWLQTLNISMQESGRFRREIYNLKDICCEEANGANSYDQASVICASPEYLSGKQIISLKEEDFPDLKLTSFTLPPPRQVYTSEPYLPQTSTELPHHTSSGLSDMIDASSKTTSSIYTVTDTTFKEPPTFVPTTENLFQTSGLKASVYESKPELFKTKTISNAFASDKLHINLINSTKLIKSINHAANKWKYLKSETKYKLTSPDPVFVLLNDTKSVVRDLDNQLNESISSGAYSAHEHPATSHPGMVVFLVVVGVILVASSAMVYTQCKQSRHGQDYHPHQDIEVSSFGGNDLW